MQQGVKSTKETLERDRQRRWLVLPLRNPAETAPLNHRLDWLDAGDGLFGEWESESDVRRAVCPPM